MYCIFSAFVECEHWFTQEQILADTVYIPVHVIAMAFKRVPGCQ